MLDLDKKREVLDKICSGKTFSNAPTSIALLKYLFEQTVSGNDLKESIIEIEFFGDKKSKKDNPKVRVNVYNLRKKLAQYYEAEGVVDDYRVVIEKGQYLLKFEKPVKSKLLLNRLTVSDTLPYIIILILSVVIVLVSLPPLKPSVWETFLDKKKQTTLYIGDAYGMIGKTVTGNTGWTRDYSINNADDLYDYLETNTDLKNELGPAPYAYATQMAVLSAKKMQKLFSRYDKDFMVRFLSKATIDDIKEGNSVYVGPVKNDNPFIKMFNEANVHFNIVDSNLYLYNHSKYNDTVYRFPYRVSNEEYAVVSKIPGPDNTEQLLFFANHDIGVSSTFDFFTNADSLKVFAENHLIETDHFTAIFKAKGVNRTDTDLELLMVIPVK